MTTRTTITEIAPMEEVVAVVTRLQSFLPEYGRNVTDAKFSEHVKAVTELEGQLIRARMLMRESAARIVAKVKANWTDAEIVKACGYESETI